MKKVATFFTPSSNTRTVQYQTSIGTQIPKSTSKLVDDSTKQIDSREASKASAANMKITEEANVEVEAWGFESRFT